MHYVQESQFQGQLLIVTLAPPYIVLLSSQHSTWSAVFLMGCSQCWYIEVRWWKHLFAKSLVHNSFLKQIFVSLDANNFCKLIPLVTTESLPFNRTSFNKTSTLGKYFGYSTFVLQIFVLGHMTLLTSDCYVSKSLSKAIFKSMQHLGRQLFILIAPPSYTSILHIPRASQGLKIIS